MLRRNRWGAIAGPTLLLLIAGCTDDADSETIAQSSAAMVIGGSASGDSALIGEGFDPQTVSFKSQCVTGDIVYSGSPSATIRMTKSLSADELRNALGVDVSASVKASAFNGNVAVKFATESSSASMSEAFIFSYEMLGKNALLTNGRLTDIGQKLIGRDVSERKQACGTEFVQQVELGAQLFVSVRFDFATQDAKDEFKLALGGSISMGSLQVAVDVAKKTFKKNVTVKVLAFQVGGNAAALGNLLAPDGDKVPSLLCGIDKPEECEKTLAKVVAYASTDFPTQVNSLKWDPTQPVGAAVLKYHTTEYVSGGFPDLLREPSPITALAILQNRQDLYRKLLTLYQDRSRIFALKDKVFALSDDERAAIDVIETKIHGAELQLLEASSTCYNDIENCGAVAAQMFEDLNTKWGYSRDDLIKLPTFFDYCTGYEADEAGELLKTVTAIKDAEGLSSYSCLEAAKQLKMVNTLELPGKNISDIRPLLGLWNLNYLNLRDNHVKTLAPLASLTKLIYLDLRNNGLSNVGEIQYLTQLKELDLAWNKIRILLPLQGLTKLEVLKLFGNPFVDSAPVDGLALRKKLLYVDDICVAERDALLAAKRISKVDYDTYTELNFAPLYAVAGGRSSAITSWVVCDAAVDQLPEGM